MWAGVVLLNMDRGQRERVGDECPGVDLLGDADGLYGKDTLWSCRGALADRTAAAALSGSALVDPPWLCQSAAV